MNEEKLRKWYLEELLSVAEIASKVAVSQHKINYWISKYKIPKRSISEAVYLKSNPNGDPFCYRRPKKSQDWLLMGLGIGLFWGEGNKRSKSTIRLGNTDPKLIRAFMNFLRNIYNIDKNKIRCGLQVFSDTSPGIAKRYWIKELKIPASQFYKVTVTPARNLGTYRYKSIYGVLTIHFSNTKLKKIIDNLIENFPTI